ncbi:MAG: ParB/RepB/Spo0J family partition protein [Angustibacter sp.]
MQTNTTPKTATAAQITLVQVDPAAAVVGLNVRSEANLTADFVSSIRELGVLEPVVGHYDEQGQFVVLRGQRRTLAAVETKQASIPAVVVQRPEDADRIVQQMAENDHRTGMTTADRIAGVKQLAAFGLTAAQIKRRTARPRSEVDAALVVAGSELAANAAQRWDYLTLDQAAILAEFEDDPEAVKALMVAAKEGHGFEHTAQRLRDAREDAAAIAAMTEELTAKGVVVVDRPAYDDKTVLGLDRLAATKGGRAYSKATHATCTGHAAYLRISTGWEKNEKGKEVRVRQAEPEYVCTNWRGAGHVYRWDHTSASSTPTAADMSPEEREQARAERRDVIDSNKAWDTAEPVRRDWLAAFAARKTAPKGSSAFIARVVTEHPEVVPDVGGSTVAAEWFGLKHVGYGYGGGWSALIEKATEGRAQVIALCRLLASLEKGTDRQSWRRVMPATTHYLTFIAAHGYDLSDVEKRAAGLVRPKPARRSRPKAAPASPVSETTEPSVDNSAEPNVEAGDTTNTNAAIPAA